MKVMDKIKEVAKDKMVQLDENMKHLLYEEVSIVGGNTIGLYEVYFIGTKVKAYTVEEDARVGVEMTETDNCWIVKREIY